MAQPTGSQHTDPKSDIDIARAATKRPILDLAEDRLGISPEHLVSYGHDKAKLTLDYIGSLENRPDGKLILVTAITPTPAGEGKTTTTVGLGDGLNRIGKNAVMALREPSLGPCFGVKGALPAAAMRRWCRWRTSTSTSPATSTPSVPPTTCSRRWWTTTSTGATRPASTRAG